jgi:hypothetical protein
MVCLDRFIYHRVFTSNSSLELILINEYHVTSFIMISMATIYTELVLGLLMREV